MFKSYAFQGIDNFRDLGGYECDYGMTSYGVVYRSATPVNATPADIEKIVGLGIRSVIDLREDSVKKTHPSPFKGDSRFKVIELNVNGSGRVPVDHDDVLASYMEMVEDPYSARRIIRALLDCEKPCLIHCNAGKDRTGVFAALILTAQGVRFDDVNADYMSSFPYLFDATEKLLEMKPDFPEVCLRPNIHMLHEFMQMFFEKYEDFDGYFEAIGLSEADANAFKNILGVQEKSCGAVVFHQGKVLVEHMAAGHYSIPKGHVEPIDESDEATAIREIKEETCLDASIKPGFHAETVYSPRPGHIKKVHWFAAEVESVDVKPQEAEVREIYFLSPEDALITLTHNSDREVLISCCRYLFP